jgi:uncharacterized protein YndB with AHSA1/START domain
MMPRLLTLIFLLGAWSNAAAQQHAKRPVKPQPQDTGPVNVMRSATLRILVTSDAVTVFSYLSDQGKLSAWLADQAILEPQFGGKYHFRWKNEEPVDGVVTEFMAANSLALAWKHPTDAAETQVRFKLSPQGGGTLLQLDLQGFTSADALDKAVKSWVFNLQNLKSVIEDQVDLRPTVAKAPAHSPTRAATHARPK